MKQFKPETCALVLIDYQVGTLKLVKTLSKSLILKNAVKLAKTALAFNLPVVLTTSMEDAFQGPLSEELRELLPEAFEKRVKRQGIVNAWADPNFKSAVVATDRKQLIMGGITNDICLVFPAISAVKDGFEVQAVIDASGSQTDISEEMSRNRMERKGILLTSTETLIAELVQDWSTKEGMKLAPLLVE
jgi:nicotinamidase-related amidase